MVRKYDVWYGSELWIGWMMVVWLWLGEGEFFYIEEGRPGLSLF